MEGGFDAGKVCARPGVPSEVETVLMALGFVFVLETVVAVLTHVRFSHPMDTNDFVLDSRDNDGQVRIASTYSSSS